MEIYSCSWQIILRKIILIPMPRAILCFLILFVNVHAEMSSAFTEFGLSLYPYLQEENENTLFSPYSLGCSLAMIYLGADGETREEIRSALSLPDKIEPISFDGFKTANSLWVNDGFSVLNSYQTAIKKNFHAECKSISFEVPDAASDSINQWINSTTDGKIPKLCSPSDFTKDTQAVLVNTLSFQGQWISPFSKTIEEDFHLSSNEIKPTQMLVRKDSFLYSENESYQVAGLQLKNSDLLFLLFLPKEENLEISAAELMDSMDNMHYEHLDLALPKFTLRKRIDPKDALRNLNIRNLFSAACDLSGIDGKGDLYLDKIIHECYLSVNEFGLDAAAATASFLSKTSLPSYYIPFHLNRPFLFALFDQKAQSLLFIGKMEHPNYDKKN